MSKNDTAHKKKTGGKNPWWLKALGYLGLFLGLAVLCLFAFASLVEGRVARAVAQALDEKVKGKIEYEKMELSFLRNFPQAQLEIQNLIIRDQSQQLVVEVKQAYLQAGLLATLFGQYEFKALDLEEGSVYLRRNNEGLWLLPLDWQGEGGGLLSLHRLKLENINLNLADSLQDFDLNLNFKQGFYSDLSGKEEGVWASYGEAVIGRCRLGSHEILAGRRFAYDGRFKTEAWEHEILNLEASFAGGKCKLTGAWQAREAGGYDLDLSLQSLDFRFEALAELFAAELPEVLRQLEGRDRMEVRGFLRGFWSREAVPDYDLRFNLAGGRLKHPKINAGFRSVELDMQLGNQNPQRTFLLEVFRWQMQLEGQILSMKLKLADLSKPWIDLELKGYLPLRVAHGLFGASVREGRGQLELEQVQIRGLYSALRGGQLENLEAGGQLHFNKAYLKIGDLPINLEGSMILRNQALEIRHLDWRSGAKETLSDFTIFGQVEGIFPLLFGLERGRENPLDLDLALEASRLHLGSLAQLWSGRDSLLPSVWYALRSGYSGGLRGGMAVKIDEGHLLGADLADWSGNWVFSPKFWRFNLSKGKWLGGMVEGSLHLPTEGFCSMGLSFWGRGLEAQRFSSALVAVQQEALGRFGLEGRGDVLGYGHWVWDSLGRPLRDSTYYLADGAWEQGHCSNWGALLDLSKGLGLKELDKFAFDALRFRGEWLGGRGRGVYVQAQGHSFNLAMQTQQNQEGTWNGNLLLNGDEAFQRRLSGGGERVVSAERGRFNRYFAFQNAGVQTLGGTNRRNFQQIWRQKPLENLFLRRIQVHQPETKLNPLELPLTWRDLHEGLNTEN